MSTSEERRAVIRAKHEEVRKLDVARWILLKEIKRLEQEDSKARYTCPCVRFNGSLDIWDMVQQEAAGRVGLCLGLLVIESYSAAKTCLLCKGTGKPTV